MKWFKCILILALALCAVYFCASCAAQKTIEAGTALTAQELTGDADAVFGEDFDPDCINHHGTYTFTVISGEKKQKIRLKVKDTVAPKGTVNERTYFAVGATLPDPVECFAAVDEVDSYTAEYVKKPEHLDSLGDYTVQVRLIDASGNRSPVYSAVLTLIYDKEPPQIHGAQDLVIYTGEAAIYEKNIKLTDNCAGEIRLTVDSSKVDNTVPGTYPVVYTATDTAGNQTTCSIKVHVYEQSVSTAQLNQRLDAVLQTIITPQMDREAQCRAVYSYVQDRISYAGTSEKKDWVSAAYDALFVTGSGDCYSYFAAAKAFLERLGIPNMDIQRTPGLVQETHYWSLVNIGTSASPRWYHFDCTRLTSSYKVSGCLLTDAQVRAYDQWRAGSYFRAYDSALYPASAAAIITPISELQSYLQ